MSKPKTLVIQYLQACKKLALADSTGDEETYEAIRDELDDLWYKMTLAEKEDARALSGTDGRLTWPGK